MVTVLTTHRLREAENVIPLKPVQADGLAVIAAIRIAADATYLMDKAVAELVPAAARNFPNSNLN